MIEERFSKSELKTMAMLWGEYGQLLSKVAHILIEEAHESLFVRSNEYDALRQSIEIPTQVETIKRFINVFSKKYDT